MQVDVDVDVGGEMDEPPVLTTMGQDDDRGPDFQAHKAAFFFKLERELEKVRSHLPHIFDSKSHAYCFVCVWLLDQRVLPA